MNMSIQLDQHEFTTVKTGTGTQWGKFKLLMWKNITLKRRRPFVTMVELSLPLVMFIVLVLVRHRRLPEQFDGIQNRPQCMLSNGLSCVQEIGGPGGLSPFLSSSLRRRNTESKWNSLGNSEVHASAGTSFFDLLMSKRIAYAPSGGDALRIINLVKEHLSLSVGGLVPPSSFDSIFIPFPSESEMADTASGNNTILLGVAFLDMNMTVPGTPTFASNIREIQYKMRTLPELTPDTARKLVWIGPNPAGTPMFYYSGFLFLQEAVDRAIMKFKMGSFPPPINTYFQEMPFPPYVRDYFATAISTTLPLLMTLSFIYSVSMLIKNIVYEKEQRLKELMRMMGLSSGVYWLSWFTISFLMLLVSVIFVTIIVMTGSVLAETDPFLFFIFLLLFSMSTISLTFLISVFFSKSRLAAACGGIIYFLTYLPNILVQRNAATLSYSVKMISCLFSTTAFGIGSSYISEYERHGSGLTWENWNVIAFEDNFAFSYTMWMMLLDTFLYIILAWYIESVWPGKFGVPKPWYFPFQLSYWFPSKFSSSVATTATAKAGHGNKFPSLISKTIKRRQGFSQLEEDCSTIESSDFGNEPTVLMHDLVASNSENGPASQATSRNCAFANGLSAEDCESDPVGFEAGVEITGLRKVYENGKVALQNLTLRMFENQVTALLGHNGAGKTTTMSILTGLFPPTSGTATVSGHDIVHDMDGVRGSLGICPQYNVLFDVLTVQEHMEFYCRLKGVDPHSIKSEVDKMIEDVGLVDKRSSEAHTLSGGMKRKLSVGIAFIGGSRTVILDEPTAGVDPYARRSIWDLVLKHKHGRTILLSTHHMDEADLLGDRIAIIADGRLRCVGSSLFLKNRYGIGYHMALVKASESCSEPILTQFIQSIVPSAMLTGDVGAELSYVLPTSESSHFPALLQSLEERLEELQVSSYGMSVTTLEEVFLKVGEIEEAEEEEKQRKEKGGTKPDNNGSKGSGIKEVSEMDNADGGKRARKNGEINYRSALYVKRQQKSNSRGNSKPKLELMLEDDAYEVYPIPSVDNPSTDNDSSLISSLSDEGFDDADSNGGGDAKKQMRSANGGPMRLARDKGTETDMAKVNHVVVSGFALRLQQIVAMLLKRVHHAKRDKKAMLSQLLLPAAFICIAMGVALIYPPPTNPPPLVLSPYNFGDSNLIMYHETNSGPFGHSLANLVPRVSLPCDRFLNISNENIINYILDHHYQSQRECYGSFSFNNTAASASTYLANATIWYRNEGKFAMPVFMNRFNNILFTKMQLTASGASDFSSLENFINITTTIHPWPKTASQIAKEFRKQGTDLVVGIFIILAFSFVPASFVLYIVHERASKAKHMQFVSGVDVKSYWIATFAWDFFSFLFPIIVALAIFVLFNDAAYQGINFTGVALLLILYAWSMTPLMYLFSFLFEVPATAYVTLICGNLMTGITTVVATFVLDLFQKDDPDLYEINQVFKKVFLLLPNYCMGRGVMDIAVNEINNEIREYANGIPISGLPEYLHPLSLDLIGYSLICMFFEGIVCFALVFLVEYMSVYPLYREYRKKFSVITTKYSLLFKVKLLKLMGRSPTMEDSVRLRNVMDFGSSVSSFDGDDDDLPLNGGDHVAVSVENSAVVADPNMDSVIEVFADEDVEAERERVLATEVLERDDEEVDDVENCGKPRNIVIVKELCKTFKTKDRVKKAVDHVTVGIKTGECFGLLGVNGAGKTTTFKMLTGDEEPTSGDAFLDGYSIITQMKKVRERIGYCPQFDALNEFLTARELLFMYARLRGLLEPDIPAVVNWCIHKLQLEKYADRPCGTYSGGNKRKLSTAIALIGNPAVIFMDEPTTGMDPKARRFLWDVISSLMLNGRAIVFTSHSMEECEALCTKMAIMVNGTFRCIGSSQHLKSKYGVGYTLIAKIKDNDKSLVEGFKNFIASNFPDSQLKEEHSALLQYQLNSSNVREASSEASASSISSVSVKVTLASIFSKMEEAKSLFSIEDYSVNQTTLEQVFVNFARFQHDEEKSK